MSEGIPFRLNGRAVEVKPGGSRRLLWALRTELGLTGAKYGCGKGHCGGCTVLVNGQPIRSCLLPVETIRNKDVLTIEGLAQDGQLHPVQKAFLQHDALQCGFCTSGMIMQAVALLRTNSTPSEDQILAGMERNLCRCGAHLRIVRSIQTAAEELRAIR